MFSFIKPKKLLQITILFLAQFFLCLSLLYTRSGIAAVAAAPWHSATIGTTQIPTESLDVDRAAEKADQASENIYKGLDTTKRVVGKTDKRNQVIEQAREQASEKWKSLAEKAKTAQNTDTPLTPTEKQVLKQVQD